MNTRKVLYLILIVLLVWMCLPENIPIRFSVQKSKINFTINPPSLKLNILGLQINRDFKTKLGLDLKGGSHLVFKAQTDKLKKDDIHDAITAARDIIEKRVNLFGVSEPVVQTIKVGSEQRISVDLPGIENTSEAIRLIGQTAQLRFIEEGPLDPKITSTASLLERLNKDTGLSGKHINKSSVVFDTEKGFPQVSLQFTQEGAVLFEKITERNIGKPVGIFLDYFPISAPVVQQKISQGNAVISGNFTVDEAKKLSVSINSGALPVPIVLIEQRTIGPSLGATDVQKSMIAGLVGLGMVCLFMIGYYEKLGLIATATLCLYGMISFAFFRIIPVVLTLPGIAGFILSIGMAVDSNILIFERIKEERRKGRDIQSAARVGFGRALDAIKDANITTLLVSFILFNPLGWDFLPQFGLVRGFALTLGIGVATSLFTGVVITKRLIQTFYK